MSKFIDNIEAQLRHERVVPMWPNELNVKRDVLDTTTSFNPMATYDIKVEWRQKVNCYPKDINHLLNNVVRSLKEAVYGDLRNRLIRLEQAIYEHKVDNAFMEIRDIMREIT